MSTNLTPNFLFLCVKYIIVLFFSNPLYILTKQLLVTVCQQLINSPCLSLLLRLL